MAPPKKQLTSKERVEVVVAALERIQSGVAPESRPLINDYKSKKKREKRLKYSCPGPHLCKSLTCNHIYVKPSPAVTKAKAIETGEDRAINVLVDRLDSDGLPISFGYAKTKFCECDCKLLDAIKAIKEDIKRREKVLEDEGRFSIALELPTTLKLLHDPKYLALHCPNLEYKPWECKDLILDCMEREDAAFKDFTANGEKSGIALKMRGTPKLKKFLSSYQANADHRVDRAKAFQDLLGQVKRNEITAEQMERKMKYWDGVIDSDEALLEECDGSISSKEEVDPIPAKADHYVDRVRVLNGLLDQVVHNETTAEKMAAAMKECDRVIVSKEALLKECEHLIASRKALLKERDVAKKENDRTPAKADKGKDKAVDVLNDEHDSTKSKQAHYKSVSEEEDDSELQKTIRLSQSSARIGESSAAAASVTQPCHKIEVESEELTPLFTRLTEKLRASWDRKIGPYLPVKFDLRSIADRRIKRAARLNFLIAFHWSCRRTAELYIRISGSGALAIDLYSGYMGDIMLYLLERGPRNRVYTKELDRIAAQFGLLLLEASEMAEEEVGDDA